MFRASLCQSSGDPTCVPLPIVVCPVVAVVMLESRVARCVHCVENVACLRQVMETTKKITGNLRAADIDSRLEEQLIDGIWYAFQEQTTEVM
jgi:hypothetical protein